MTLGNSKSNRRKGSRSGTKRRSRSGTKRASRSGTKSGSRSGTKSGSRSGTKSGSRSGTKSGSRSSSRSRNRKKKKTRKTSIIKKTKGSKKIINNLKKFKTTEQLDKMIKNYEQTKSKNSKSLYYLTGYDKKTGKFKGEQLSMTDFIKRIKKINIDDFIRQCKAISKNKKGGGQFGGGITAKFFMMFTNITLGIAVIYVVCTGSAAQSSIATGFGALITGNCNSFAELSFRYVGLGNSVCNAWSSATTTLLLAATGSPTALAKITGATIMIMKAPGWAPRLHCAFMVKIAEVCVLGDVMVQEELDVLKNMYTPYGRRLGGDEGDEGDGPEFEVLNDA
jgi:hypothetical protein